MPESGPQPFSLPVLLVELVSKVYFLQNLALSTFCKKKEKKKRRKKLPVKTILVIETGKQSSRGPLPGIQ